MKELIDFVWQLVGLTTGVLLIATLIILFFRMIKKD